jgi:hypothetical protein
VKRVREIVNIVEDREQPVPRSRGVPPRFRLDPAVRPHFLTAVEKRDHERVPRREVTVERRVRQVGAQDHVVDADRADAARREHLVRAIENALARGPHASDLSQRADRLRF